MHARGRRSGATDSRTRTRRLGSSSLRNLLLVGVDEPAQRSSESRPADAGTAGLTGTRVPVRIQARWLGAKRGASNPSLISRVTANRLKAVAGRKRRVLS